MKLTSKQRLFADEYIKSGNATESYIKAGYSVKTNSSAKAASSRLLTNVNLKTYIDAKMAEIESHKIADAKEVLQFYTRVLRAEETEKVVDVVNGGLIESPPTIKERTAAAKELMKRYPLSDPIVKEQLRKTKADADLTEEKVKAARQLTNSDNVKLNQLLDAMEKGVSSVGNSADSDN